jgi:hypothetical protein
MRLTLRTMLAYLDDLLEPADREDVGRKIADSEFAAQLVERVGNCTRNPRLASPKLTGRGLDPNTVAEYLDNTLAGERVPDFEKVCLESDVYLAEVAASHQILTMVLGQPAQVDPQLKRRMYNVINQSPDAGIPGLAPPPLPARRDPFDIGDEHARPARSKPEIPDYLREKSKGSSWKPILAALILFALLAGAIAMALGPFDQLIGLNQPPKNQPAQNAPAQNTDANPVAPNQADATNAAGSNALPVAPPDRDPAAAPAENAPEPSLLQPASVEPRNTAPHGAEPPSINFDAPATADAAATPNNTVAPQTDVNSAPPLPQPGTNPATAMPAPSSVDVAMPPAVAAAPIATPAATPNEAAAIPANNVPVGRLVPDSNVVLLKFDSASNAWVRVPAGASLMGGDQLLVLATYRPTIALSAGIALQVPAETAFTLLPLDSNGVPGIKVAWGKVVALTNGKAGSQLRVDVGANSGTLTFNNSDATVGIEVRRFFLPGANPETAEPQIAAELFAKDGQLEWTARDGTMATLMAPQRWSLIALPAGVPPMEANQVPKWISGEPLNASETRASEALAGLLDSGKPIMVALREMATQRRVENRELAAECLAQLDQFEPLISAFNDPDQRAMWPLEIACVKTALARSPNTAAAVREALARQRGEDAGKDLYRMFWGYTKSQLQQDGEAAKLVGYLDHDNLDFRVLAFSNLYGLTGAHHNYRPEAPDQTRKQPTRQWQEALRTGQIIPKESPAK